MASTKEVIKQGINLFKQVVGNMAQMKQQSSVLFKTNPLLKPMYQWWYGRFWAKEESCYVNRGRARIYTYLALVLLIRSRSVKRKQEFEEMKEKSKDTIIATALQMQ